MSLQKDFILRDGQIFRFFNNNVNNTQDHNSPCWYPYEQFLKLVSSEQHEIKWYFVPQNVYIFYGKMSSEFLTTNGEYKWNDILNATEIRRMRNDGGKIVLGYIVIGFDTDDKKPIVSYFKNYISYNGLLEIMLQKIEDKYDLHV